MSTNSWKKTGSWFVLSALMAGFMLMIFTDAGWTGPRGKEMRGRGMHERGGQGLMRGLMSLDSLTDEQRDKIADYKASAEKEKIQLKSEIETLKVDLRMLMRSDEPNRSKVGDLAEKIGELKGTLQRGRLMHQLDIRGVLTQEQRDELKEMRAKKQGRQGCHPQGMRGIGHRRGGCASPPPFHSRGPGAPSSEF